MFKCPCVVEQAQYKAYGGHSSHIPKVRFTPDDVYLISVGGNDKSVFVWETDFGSAQANVGTTNFVEKNVDEGTSKTNKTSVTKEVDNEDEEEEENVKKKKKKKVKKKKVKKKKKKKKKDDDEDDEE